ncbi:hypothetical protein GCM10008986_10380 [Salinibacillus aidingensis]|uniref:Uncharacterized protein n=1 Tax=Salinibacillus aidingensis TaxID=237684 RepID=A0ABP3KXA6_9BACI
MATNKYKPFNIIPVIPIQIMESVLLLNLESPIVDIIKPVNGTITINDKNIDIIPSEKPIAHNLFTLLLVVYSMFIPFLFHF